MTVDAAGDLFGTTAAGGVYGDGVVFETVDTSGVYASTPNLLTSFDAPGSDGTFAEAGLMIDAAGDLFGEMAPGGLYGAGTVYEEVKENDGKYRSKTLVNFSGAHGQFPYGGLIADSTGDLFGTTTAGGADGDG